MLSEPVRMYYQNSSTFINPLGAMFTLIVLIFGTVSFFYFFAEMVEKAKPLIILNQEYASFPHVKLDEKFFFSVGIMGYNAKRIQNIHQKINTYMLYTITNGTNKQQPMIDERIEMIPCSQSERFKNYNKTKEIEKFFLCRQMTTCAFLITQRRR